MTNREFYTAVSKNEITGEVIEFAANAITKMDAANAKRKEKPSKAAIANAPLYEQILSDILTFEPKTASEVAAALECSTQKASGLLRVLVNEGKAVSTDIKVPKKGTVKAYTLAE